MSFNCPICFGSDVDAFVRLPHCGHAFCKACICKWMEHQPSCPLCRDGVRAGERMEIEMHGCAVARDSMAKDEVVARLRMLFSDHEDYTFKHGVSLRTLLPIFLFIRHQAGRSGQPSVLHELRGEQRGRSSASRSCVTGCAYLRDPQPTGDVLV